MLDQGPTASDLNPVPLIPLKVPAPQGPSRTDGHYRMLEQDRDKHVEAILKSPHRKKIVVAGPGTGKTHLFKKALQGKAKTLTLSFINALVEDLALNLCGISDVRTLHSFAGQQMKTKVFPKLSQVITED